MIIKKYYIETYGCQMNEADSELIGSILDAQAIQKTKDVTEADLIIINTCSVRDNAEKRALSKLLQYKHLKKKNPKLLFALVGCVAQRGKIRLIEENDFIDILLGPDSYRKFPEILNEDFNSLYDTELSKTELYTGIEPQRESGLNAWISIMRGCDKFCTYCIVPYTRGRERSRSMESIIHEAEQAVADGKIEITLLGQNVNSYCFKDNKFPDLLRSVSEIKGLKRIRFTSPHPKDISDNMLKVMKERDNICKNIHLPLQSGSSKVLKKMNRSYDQSYYLKLVEKIRKFVPNMAITTDIIVGFPREEEEDFQETLNVMEKVKFDSAFMFKYSPRPGTKAAKMEDDVSEENKSLRLQRVIDLQKKHTLEKNKSIVGSIQEILIEGNSKKNSSEKIGRTDSNKIVILKKGNASNGEFVKVRILSAHGVSLFAETK